MDQSMFERAITGHEGQVESVRRLARRFTFALRHTRDVHSAMAAVNEHLVEPLSYREFLSLIRA